MIKNNNNDFENSKNQQKQLKEKLKRKQEIRALIREFQTKIKVLQSIIIDIDNGHDLSEKTKNVIGQVKNSCFVCITNKKRYEKQIVHLQEQLSKEKKKYKDLETDLYRDSLTGVYNRKKFDEVYKNEILKISLKQANNITLALLDINNFTSINDTYGYSKGNIILQKIISKIIQLLESEIGLYSQQRKIHIFRYNGDKFALLTRYSPKELEIFLLNIISYLEKNSIDLGNTENIENITFSVGISQYGNSPLKNPQILLKEAEFSLDNAKKKGKGKIVTIKYKKIPQNNYKTTLDKNIS